MADDVKTGFELRAITLQLQVGDIVPTKQVTPGIRLSVKYKQIAASVAEVGVIEPLVVYPMNGAAGKYVLLDGHLRLDVLKQRGEAEARCIVSVEEEGFTYNKKVNHLATIQEHYMILKAIRPAASTVPANSIPRIRILVGRKSPLNNVERDGSAFLYRQSAGQSVVARTRMRMSFSPGSGLSTSRIWTTSGGP